MADRASWYLEKAVSSVENVQLGAGSCMSKASMCLLTRPACVCWHCQHVSVDIQSARSRLLAISCWCVRSVRTVQGQGRAAVGPEAGNSAQSAGEVLSAVILCFSPASPVMEQAVGAPLSDRPDSIASWPVRKIRKLRLLRISAMAGGEAAVDCPGGAPLEPLPCGGAWEALCWPLL